MFSLIAPMSSTLFDTVNSQVRARLRPDDVFIFPTETLYGIGCSIRSEAAIERVLQIKNRRQNQLPPVLIADIGQLETLTAESALPLPARRLIAEFWPGSLTLVLPAREELPEVLCGRSADGKTRTVGVRHTAHPVAATICRVLSAPIIATSANFTGATGRAAAPRSLNDIPPELKQMVDLVIDGGTVGGSPSTVVDCTSNPPRILRAGAVELPAITVDG